MLGGNVIKITNDTLPRAIIILDVAFAGKQAIIQNNNVTVYELNTVDKL